MTRCCASFSNCSPSPAGVVIHRTTNNYIVSGDQIAWRQERLVNGGTNHTPLVGANQSVTDPTSRAIFTALSYFTLLRAPVSPYSLQAYVRGSTGQRPLVAYSQAQHNSGVHDYFVIGDKLYINFELATGEDIFVHYVGIPQPGDPTALEVGSMSAVTLPDPYAAPSGYILADGVTPYSSVAYSALYAWLLANGNDVMIPYDVLGAQTETYEDAASITVPPGSFVVRYLDPTTFAALPEPESGNRIRSATHRVLIKT